MFAPAVRENVNLIIAIAGASGSGKTFSALRLAQGISPAGKIAFIDSEARRGLHYADKFKFLHADMRPPFNPEAFVKIIGEAERTGAEVVIIDSFSHEYDGPGGIVDWADELAAKGVKSPGNWKEPKLAHKKLMQYCLQSRVSFIFCLRADEKIEIIREGGKTVVRPLGWSPICEKRFLYETVATFTLVPNAPGIPQFDLPHKLQDQHRPFFPAGQPIGEEAGRLLAEWARGAQGGASVVVTPDVPPDVLELAKEGQDAADRGTAVLAAFWKRLTPTQQRAVGGKAQLDKWKQAALEIDAAEVDENEPVHS